MIVYVRILASVLIAAALSLQKSGKPLSVTFRRFKVTWGVSFLIFFSCSLVLFSEALTFTKKPDDPRIVVEGVNNTDVNLIWDILPGNNEVVNDLFLLRRRPGDAIPETIASRKFSSSFTLATESFSEEYRAYLPATLRLLNVDNTEEYIYALQVSFDLNNVPKREEDQVRVIVRGKSNSFALYLRRIYKSVT